MGPGAPTLDEMFDYMFSNAFHGYAKYNLLWWKEYEKNPDRILILFYEDALMNLTETVEQVAKFIGKNEEWCTEPFAVLERNS